MSGIRVFNFREGDRSEYLANYILSGLGLVTAISRQEDVGFDFYCQLADTEKGILSFGFPFVIQIKSDGDTSIVYGQTNSNKWVSENIDWLFRLEIPLFIGVICKKKMQLEIYNTSPLNFLYFEDRNASIVELNFQYQKDNVILKKPDKQIIDNWEKGKGNGYRHIIDLGAPLITIDNEDLQDIERLKNKKDMLRNIVSIEQENYLFRKLKVPFFFWTKEIKTNEEIKCEWAHLTPLTLQLSDLFSPSLAQCIISIAINCSVRGNEKIVKELKPLLKRINKKNIPSEIKRNFPHFFE